MKLVTLLQMMIEKIEQLIRCLKVKNKINKNNFLKDYMMNKVIK